MAITRVPTEGSGSWKTGMEWDRLHRQHLFRLQMEGVVGYCARRWPELEALTLLPKAHGLAHKCHTATVGPVRLPMHQRPSSVSELHHVG